jgi:hypothetical protein
MADGKWGNILQTVNLVYRYSDPSRMWGNDPYILYAVNERSGAPIIIHLENRL